MSTLPDHPAWGFVISLYGAPEVAPACLELQERHGIDVTLMLFCLWRGVVSGEPLTPHLASLMETAAIWRSSTVLPIRTARQWLKSTSAADPALACLYKTVLSAEIECEHAELLALANQMDAQCAATAHTSHPAAMPVAMTANLAAFLAATGITLSEQDHAAIAIILAAAKTACIT